jgi:hypothetical protein
MTFLIIIIIFFSLMRRHSPSQSAGERHALALALNVACAGQEATFKGEKRAGRSLPLVSAHH